MNKRFVMIHLQEAMEELQDTIKALQTEGTSRSQENPGLRGSVLIIVRNNGRLEK